MATEAVVEVVVCPCDNTEYCDPTDPFYSPPCAVCNWHHGISEPCEADDPDE